MKKALSLIAFAFALCLLPSSAKAQVSCPAGANHCITVAWSAPTSGGAPTGYNVYRANATGGCSTVTAASCTKLNSAAISASTFTFTDSPLPQLTKYYYVVTAFNAAGESGPSSEVNFTTLADPAPAAPINVTVTGK